MRTAGQCWRMCSVYTTLAAVSSRCAGLGDAVSLPILIWSQQSAPSTHTYTPHHHRQIDTVQVGQMSVILIAYNKAKPRITNSTNVQKQNGFLLVLSFMSLRQVQLTVSVDP